MVMIPSNLLASTCEALQKAGDLPEGGWHSGGLPEGGLPEGRFPGGGLLGGGLPGGGPNGDALRKCILKGPYTPTIVTTPAVPATKNSPAVPEQTTVETVMNMTPENKPQLNRKRIDSSLICDWNWRGKILKC
ncbi:hypothetical protein Tco_0975243 [Tanacetum coccineum]|uniref:Uncharacterized protein n=1 Tax=Tanacetum coccineum TaxID=301880 RepID=A0ABQ5EDZ0_9ASTR